ncbi:hypothetical protein [Evansella tamaricis]|uniref:Uncharacterized protein n=1 Tax=Evansella tamaricis TaxID=2069301 RepID=A0ABS6JKL6_9BACI|nr:hypothetical protein [Evansella tamaricis]MBU9713925.1 hypothetical protein [Evansella tamaricis]
MTNEYVFKSWSGVSSIFAGSFLFLAHTIHLIASAPDGTVLGKSLVLTAHIILVFSFIGLYEVHGKRNGILGNLSMFLGVIGTVSVSAIVFVELTGAYGVDVSSIFEQDVPYFIHLIGPLLFVIGVILTGVTISLGKIFPKLSGFLLILGTVIFALGSMFGSLEGLFSVIGSAFTASGFIWTGWYLLSMK